MNTSAGGPSPWVWLGLPLTILTLPPAVFGVSPSLYEDLFRSESGLIEQMTAGVLAISVGFGVSILRRHNALPSPWLKPWFVLFTFGALYFLGEEVSWGQHLFGWGTPESFAALNDQSETNLHNLGGTWGTLLDQGPRSLLTAAALIGGVLGPILLRRRRRAWTPQRHRSPWIWPHINALPSALGALTVTVPAKLIGDDSASFLGLRQGDSKEALLALMLLVYIWTVHARCLPKKAASKRVDLLGTTA